MSLRRAAAAAGVAVALPVLGLVGRSPVAVAAGCDVAVTPATLAAGVAQAASGQTVCLGDGDYGTWTGTDKAITVIAAPDALPRMQVDFGRGDGGFTLAGMTDMGGSVHDGAHDFTIRDSTFTSPIRIEATDANIVLDHNRHDWDAVYDDTVNAKIFVWNETGDFSGVTVENSTIRNGNLDGVHVGGGAGVNVVGNVFANICDTGTNHTDNVQFEGGRDARIAGNYIYAPPGCDTQGITSYDGGTDGLTIEDNVIDVRRPWGIELYSDHDSVIRHNTLRWYNRGDCQFNSTCGQIDIDRKPDDPAGSGTQVYDNLTTAVQFSNGSTGTAHDNVSAQQASFVGPLDIYAGFKLAPDSPVGLGAATDGSDLGARIPAATPTPTPTATATATAAATPSATATPTPTATPAPAATPGATASPAPAATALPQPLVAHGPAGLVAAFGFDEGAGIFAADASGQGDRGTLHRATWTPAGRHGGALALAGHGYVSVPGSAALRLGKAMTLEAWVRPAATGRRHAALITQPGAYALELDRGHAGARIRAGRAYAVSAARRLAPARWSHVAATFDGRVLRVYVNGRPAGSRRAAGRIRSGTGPLRIGDGFTGRMDDVKVWSRALSASAVRAEAGR